MTPTPGVREDLARSGGRARYQIPELLCALSLWHKHKKRDKNLVRRRVFRHLKQSYHFVGFPALRSSEN